MGVRTVKPLQSLRANNYVTAVELDNPSAIKASRSVILPFPVLKTLIKMYVC